MRNAHRIALYVALAAGCIWRGDLKAQLGQEPAAVPEIVVDESASDWVVDRFAGNSTAGPVFFQGPAREVGGLGRCVAVPGPDGTVFIAFGGRPSQFTPDAACVAKVGPDGILRLIVGGGGNLVEGTPDRVVGGVPTYNPHDGMLYLTGPNCLRRLVERPDGSRYVEVVAGIPGKPGYDDGPAKTATFTRIDDVVIDSKGTIYVLDYNERLRKIENGQVTTLNTRFRSGGKLADGPLAEAQFAFIGLGGGICLGEDDDTLYVADHWNFAVRKIDLKTMTVSTIAGVRKEQADRFNRNADGPALTHASFNSGCCYVCWDPVHKALWCGGPDERRLRWLKPDGWIKTVVGANGADNWPRDGLGVPADQVKLVWNAVLAVDDQGRAYIAASSDPNGIWLAYNKKEVAP